MFSAVQGIIDRRLLINFRADPAAVAAILPQPFRPKTIDGQAIIGVCLIRLRQERPMWAPSWLGITSENAAHRVAVAWDENGQYREGVWIPRRDTNARFNRLVGGRFFPGLHHHARFDVREEADRYSISVNSRDGAVCVIVEGQAAAMLPKTSVFSSLEQASGFFETGSMGCSATRCAGVYDRLELQCDAWHVTPLAVRRVESSFIERQLPHGAVEFDCALLMRNVPHRWLGHAPMTAEAVLA